MSKGINPNEELANGRRAMLEAHYADLLTGMQAEEGEVDPDTLKKKIHALVEKSGYLVEETEVPDFLNLVLDMAGSGDDIVVRIETSSGSEAFEV